MKSTEWRKQDETRSSRVCWQHTRNALFACIARTFHGSLVTWELFSFVDLGSLFSKRRQKNRFHLSSRFPGFKVGHIPSRVAQSSSTLPKLNLKQPQKAFSVSFLMPPKCKCIWRVRCFTSDLCVPLPATDTGCFSALWRPEICPTTRHRCWMNVGRGFQCNRFIPLRALMHLERTFGLSKACGKLPPPPVSDLRIDGLMMSGSRDSTLGSHSCPVISTEVSRNWSFFLTGRLKFPGYPDRAGPGFPPPPPPMTVPSVDCQPPTHPIPPHPWASLLKAEEQAASKCLGIRGRLSFTRFPRNWIRVQTESLKSKAPFPGDTNAELHAFAWEIPRSVRNVNVCAVGQFCLYDLQLCVKKVLFGIQ